MIWELPITFSHRFVIVTLEREVLVVFWEKSEWEIGRRQPLQLCGYERLVRERMIIGGSYQDMGLPLLLLPSSPSFSFSTLSSSFFKVTRVVAPLTANKKYLVGKREMVWRVKHKRLLPKKRSPWKSERGMASPTQVEKWVL